MVDLPAIILAGGRAARMGGGDKPLRDLGDRPILTRVIERLTGQCAPLALGANGDPARFSRFNLPVLADSLPGYPGPLAGILAGMDWAAALGASHVISVPGDTPFLPADLAARLWAARGTEGLALAATRDRAGNVRHHPTCGLWPVALRDDLRAALAAGLRKVRLWAEMHRAGYAEYPIGPFDPFFNINRPEDIAAAEALLRKAQSV